MSIKRTIRGVDFTIGVSDEGKFIATFQGEQYVGKSLEELEDKLKDATRRALGKIKIQFQRFYQDSQATLRRRSSFFEEPAERFPRIRDGVVTGYNIAQRGLIIEWKDQPKGKRGEVHSDHWTDSTDLILESDTERAELTTLYYEYDAALARLDRFLKERKINLSKLWDEQVKEAT